MVGGVSIVKLLLNHYRMYFNDFHFQTLYTYPDNFRAWKVLIAAEYSGAKIKNAANFVFGETNVSKEFLAKFPSGKVSI